MSKLSKALIAAAGNSGGAGLTVEDVFSTYLYSGTSATHDINNNVNLADEGGLVWIKGRSGVFSSVNHRLFDTERGVYKHLATNLTSSEGTHTNTLTAFNTDGFTLGTDASLGEVNYTGMNYASWTFRKAEKFFDVVTYTGDGASSRYINHNLGANAGAIFIKRTDSASDWTVQHRYNNNYNLYLNSTSSQSDSGATNRFNDTEFTVIGSGLADSNKLTNISGATYVAYLFASDAGGFGDDGSENIIKCGSYTGTGANDNAVDVGFEPQWLLWKPSSTTGDWQLVDNMRGFTASGVGVNRLEPNTSDAEAVSGTPYCDISSTGFVQHGTSNSNNGSGQTYIYIAIRRPMKTPESGTEVFEAITYTGDNSTRELNTTILSDAVRIGSRNTAGWATGLQSRITGNEKLFTSSTGGAAGDSWGKINAWDYQGAIEFTTGSSGFQDVNGSGITYVAHAFKRATGFFDVVAYTGNGVAGRTVAHNLGVAPELMIVKSRSGAFAWAVYANPLTASNRLLLNSSDAASSANYWNSTEPTDSVFTVDGNYFQVNGSSATYIAYLFATLAGVSKVGSYTGTGTTNNIDCGFNSSARFVMVKRTSSTGDWYVWDSARGITVGSDPFLKINTSDAEGTTSDIIQPYSSGFTLTSNAGTAINGSGSSFIFLAIA